MKVFGDEITTGLGRLSKADCPPWYGWASSNQLKVWIEQEGWPSMNKAELSLLDCLEQGHSLSLLSNLYWSIVSSWGMSLLTFRWTYTSRISRPPAWWLKILGLLSLHNCVNQFLTINLSISLYNSSTFIFSSISISYQFCLSGESWLIANF